MLQFFSKTIFLLLLCFCGISGYAQQVEISTDCNVSKSNGDDLFPSWSQDGTAVVYQSYKNSNWEIYQYDLIIDSVTQLTNSLNNEEHPVLLSHKKQLAYTSDVSGDEQLYFFDLVTGAETPIYGREINAKAASFPTSEYLLYNLGFDKLSKEWGLYRYEFKYPSLKYIMTLKSDNHLPKVSPDGEYILLVTENEEKSLDQLNILNWYGNIENEFNDFNFIDANWHPDGLKITFVSDMDKKSGEVYTIWRDGSHLERWTDDEFFVRNPVVSPTGKHLAVSVLLESGYDLFIIPLEDN